MEGKLTRKQTSFIEAYISNGFNATKAAISAGYSQATARQTGSRLLTNVDIAHEISRRLADQVMSRDEALAAMSDMARSDIDDFLTVPGTFPYIDLDKARRLGKTALIKKIKVRGDGGMEIELYDKQAAIRDIGKHHGLWKDGVEIKVDVTLVAELVRALEAAEMDVSTTFERMIQKAQERANARSD